MKKIDIDQLDRKNPYKVPAGAFEDLQSKVLSGLHQTEDKTIKKSGKIFSLDFRYAAAAAIVLLFGIGFFMFDGSTVLQDKPSIAEVVDSNFANKNLEEKIALHTPQYENSLAESEVVVQRDDYQVKEDQVLKSAPVKSTKAVSKKSSKAVKANFDENVESLLSVYTSAELAKLNKEAEQDIYLDIFN